MPVMNQMSMMNQMNQMNMMNMPMQANLYNNRQKHSPPMPLNKIMPMQKPQQPVLKQKEFGTYEQIKKNKEVFMKKPIDFQRTILGELLFPMITEIISAPDKEFVPKITGMLIDFSVFEVDDILELFEDKEALKERVQEAVDLI